MVIMGKAARSTVAGWFAGDCVSIVDIGSTRTSKRNITPVWRIQFPNPSPI